MNASAMPSFIALISLILQYVQAVLQLYPAPTPTHTQCKLTKSPTNETFLEILISFAAENDNPHVMLGAKLFQK